jgi:glycosyltransferase involved in cell wall biosynthesis
VPVEVSVIIPVLDDADRLVACLDALHQQVGAPPFEVVVVDNGSQDGSPQRARDHPLRPRVVLETRRGSYAARNAGLAVATAPVLAFTDADCLPAPDWVARGSQAMSRSVVGGEVRPIRSPVPTVWERYDSALYLKQESLIAQGGFAATANLWVRRQVLTDVGDFNASLRSSGDFEWGLRAAAHGHPTAYAPDVVVEHQPRTTARQTWQLHRRLGAGWGVLVDDYPQLRRYRDVPLWQAIDALAADGPALRRRHVAHVHGLAMTARRLAWWQSRLGPR